MNENNFTTQNDSPDIDDVSPLTQRDSECLACLQRVLEKYGMEDRFGVTLLHRHFTLADDEMMLETQDLKKRVLTSRPVPLSKLADRQFVATAWRFRNKKIYITGGCAGGPYGGTKASHYGYKDDSSLEFR